jgi:hypothetical protein
LKSRLIVITAGMLSALLLAAQVSGAPGCGNNDFILFSDSSTQGLWVVGNAGYRGVIADGAMSPGTWTMTFNDAGWGTTSTARRNYLRGRYVYDSVNNVHRATFSPSEVTVQLNGSNVTLDGTAQVVLTVVNTGNSSLSNGEMDGNQTLSATITTPCGAPTALCGGNGDGSGGVTLNAVTSGINGAVATNTCATAVEPKVWTSVKELYR